MSSSDDALALLREPRPKPPWRARLAAFSSALLSRDLSQVARPIGFVLATLATVSIGWWALRPPEVPVEARLPIAAAESVTAQVAEPLSTPQGGVSTTAPAVIFVHVAGEVHQPGLVVISDGSRVVDALGAAGGLTASADHNRINLAAPVVDGERLFVPPIGDAAIPAVVAGSGAGVGGGPAGSPVNLNAATVEQLEALPGVGPATAAAIVSHRENEGPFASVVDLLDVPGIGDAKLAALRDLVAV